MTAAFGLRGPLAGLAPGDRARLLDRGAEADAALRHRTAELIAEVRTQGDAALRRMALEFDRARLASLAVPREAWFAARDGLDPALRAALTRAAGNIAAAHRPLLPVAQRYRTADGVALTRRPDPLDSVGVYAPGGRAAYPSSVLMGAVPARVAGVGRVVICSPPGPDGAPPAVVLAAAAIAEADEVFAVGGAGAIAALAYGTETIRPVDRIVGPGNAWVAEAKLQVSRRVGIDAPAGPSELLILADDSADPAALARELLAQAEHDPRAAVVLLTDAPALAAAVERAVSAQTPGAERADIIVQALAGRSACLVVESLDAGIAFANAYAAEHVLVACRDARAVADRMRHAGTILIGPSSSVAFGDYLTGANHVLPTGGAARAWSGLSTADFMRWTTIQEIPEAAAARLAGDVDRLARSEGLPAHARAASAWKRP